jgi:hypothetical protein
MDSSWNISTGQRVVTSDGHVVGFVVRPDDDVLVVRPRLRPPLALPHFLVGKTESGLVELLISRRSVSRYAGPCGRGRAGTRRAAWRLYGSTTALLFGLLLLLVVA